MPRRPAHACKRMDIGTDLSKQELQSLVTGWGGVGWTAAHDTMQGLGGAGAGWLTAATGSPKLAMAIGLPLMLANAFTASSPILRTFTSLGPGLMAGAAALQTHNWITRARRGKSTLRAA